MAEIRVKSTGTIKLFENDNTSSVTIASPASLGGDRTITLPDASVTLASGTMLATDGSGASLTALNASELGSGTVPTARLGSGTASSTTVLYGDQTYKTEPSSVIRPNVEPIIINGDMNFSQRSTSVASISSGNGWRTVDRFRDWTGTAGTWTSTQETLTSGDAYEDGFIQALKWDCTTANGSLSAGSYLIWSTSLEAQNCALFKKGTSEAEIMTLAFWVKATKTGTNTVGIYDSVNNRAIRQAYTIDSTDTWEKKVMTFAGDTSGALGTGAAKAIEVTWYWVAGSNRTSGTLQTTWGTDVTADSAVGQVNHADSTSNNIHMTGVQLEVGSYTAGTIPSFQHEGSASSLNRCQRYFEIFTSGAQQDVGPCAVWGSAAAYGGLRYQVEKRTSPTITVNSGTDFGIRSKSADTTCTSVAFSTVTPRGWRGDWNVSSGLTDGSAGWIQGLSSSSYIWIDAEM
jgi:hypothetical protein